MEQLKQYSTEELQDGLKSLIEDNPFYLLEHGFLYIKNKAGLRVKFVLNDGQRVILEEVKKDWFAGVPVRIIVLKARQLGISTLVQAIIFCVTSQYDYINSLVMGYVEENSNHLFEMSKFYYDNLYNSEYKFLLPALKKSNAKRLEFEKSNSNIKIETAKNKASGTGVTLQNIHSSEVSQWSNAKENFTSLNQAMPLLARTIHIIESTAKGVGEPFHILWKKAVENKDNPTYLWKPIFLAWHTHKEYRIPLLKDEVLELSNDEKEAKVLYKLDMEQLNWRRFCIENNCGGDINVFKEQYPSNADEAFLSSGRPVFDTNLLMRLYNYAEEKEVNFKKYSIEDYQGDYRFVLETHGEIDIYSMPQYHENYMMICDVAEGVEGGDYSVCNVLNIKTGEQVAHLVFEGDPDLFAKKCCKIAIIYNNCLIIPERNNHGHSFINTLDNQLHYGNIYKFKDDDKLGFPTNKYTRPKSIDSLKRFIRDGYFTFNSIRTISELLTFVNRKGKDQAVEGCHDDEVATYWIASFVIEEGFLSSIKRNVPESDAHKNLDVIFNQRMGLLQRDKAKANKTSGY